MRYYFALIFVLFTSFNANGFEIFGKAIGFEGKFIRLYVVSDFVSEYEIKSDVFKILEDGSFKLNALNSNPCLARLKIDDKAADVVILPNLSVQISISFDENLNKDKIFNKELSIEILNNSDKGINPLIWNYQKEVASFLEKNHAKLVTKHILPEVQKFQIAMRAIHAYETQKYFNVYLDYSLAALEDAVLGSETKLYGAYIINKPIEHANIGYMNFFVQFYQDRFMQIAQGGEGFQFLSAINGNQDYEKMMEIVKKQPFINNDTLAELFVICGIQEVFGHEQFEKDKLLSMLETIKEHAISHFNKNIAENVLAQLTFLNLGKTAPDFNLFDEAGKIYHLSTYKEKNVLLFFWSAQSPLSLKEISVMDEYNSKFQGLVDFIGINIDDDRNMVKRSFISKNHEWKNLYKDKQFDVIDKYRIYSVPTYVLIDSQGKIFSYPVKNPEENLELELSKISSKK